jgi:hypothetical protein
MPGRMSDDEKDGIRGGELADEGAGPAGTPAEAAIRGDGLAEGAGGEAAPDEEIGEDGVRGDGLAEEG